MIGEFEDQFLLEQEPDILESTVRRDRPYIRWIQRSLNQIMRTTLAVDGILGPQIRRAIRRFQRRHRLKVDGIVGSRTQTALIVAGAGPPPRVTVPSTQHATLRDLNAFSRRFVRRLIAAGRKLDCADLAIELWIRFGAQYGVPVSFEIFDASHRRWLVADRLGVRVKRTSTRVKRFRSTTAFVRYVQRNLGARGLIRNTFPVPGGHRAARAGDVFLWEYINTRTGRRHRWGHTQIIDRVRRGSGGSNSDRITIVQGSLPPIVPVFQTHPAAYFYRPRAVMMTTSRGSEPHTGILVGKSPRRFNSFRHLR